MNLSDMHNPNPGADIASLEELLGPSAYNLTPATLANKVSRGEWLPAKHLMYISGIIAHELSKGNARLIISMAPRHGKSELISKWTSLWFLNNFPMHEIILCSYGAELATAFGGQVRDLIDIDHGPEGANLLNCHLNKKYTRVAGFKTTEGGGMRSAGVGGTVYGLGADLLLIDDYFKNPEEAESQSARDKLWDWFSTVAMSRMHEDASCIIIATRWNDDDLSGRLLKLTGERWKEISLAVRIDDEEMAKADPLGREVGEVLWPELRNHDYVKEREEIMSSYFFAAVMQQKPKKPGSGRFQRDWVNVIEQHEVPHYQHLKHVRSWDLAGTEDGGDHTAGLLMAKDVRNNRVYLLDMQRFQKSPGKVKRHVKDTAELDTVSARILIEQEPGSAGKAVVEDYISYLPEYSVHGIKPTGSKLVRADPFFAAAEHGRVFMLRAPWNDDFLDECVEMSDDALEDDQVDAASQGFNDLFQVKAKAGVFGRGGKPANDTKGDEVSDNGITQSGAVVSGVTWGRK
ncbi:MAG: phage terminase large subunit [Dehalococcoidia bacterium]